MRRRSWTVALIWLFGSLILAIGGFVGPWATGGFYWQLSLALGAAWVITALVGFIVLRWRGLILLIGMPLALHYPAFAFEVLWQCQTRPMTCDLAGPPNSN